MLIEKFHPSIRLGEQPTLVARSKPQLTVKGIGTAALWCDGDLRWSSGLRGGKARKPSNHMHCCCSIRLAMHRD